MQIVLLGPPGAGKGTQAKSLKSYFNLIHISTGDLLRKAVSENTKLGVEAKEFIERGDLVPDKLVIELINERLSKPDVSRGFILDGFPRNDSQADILDKMLQKKNIILNYVVYLEASEEIIIQRLSGRRVCRSCHENFHVKNMPTKVEGICDICGGELYRRSDDQEEAIRNRLKIYTEKTESLVDYYSSQEKLLKIDANFDAPVVFEKLKSVLL
ncbi:MAG TPA: adenylate kinase [Candidatus Omnitrophica bacterium]|nr:adenylate kinase [Candidatus Omnitrophota bacterium]